MTNKSLLESYRQNGYIRLGRLFSAQEMLTVSQAFSQLLSAPPNGVGIILEEQTGTTTVRSIMGWQHAEGVLHRFANDQRIIELVQMILGKDIEFHQTKYNPKAPHLLGEKWDPHRGDTFWCFKDGVPDPTKMLSVFIALTEQTEENGAVYAWKGSHVVTLDQIRPNMLGLETKKDLSEDTASDLSLQINPETLAAFDRQFERVLFKGPPGTVWLLHASLLHASQANNSDKVRKLVANVFRTRDNRPQHPRPQSYLSEPPQDPMQPL